MVPLVSSRTAFEAKVIAARLGAEGILWGLRGGVDSIYPVGTVEVLVAEQDAERARQLLAVDERDRNDESVHHGDRRVEWLLGAGLVVFVLLFVTARILAI